MIAYDGDDDDDLGLNVEDESRFSLIVAAMNGLCVVFETGVKVRKRLNKRSGERRSE